MDSQKRWYIANLIREYLESQHLTHAEVSAKDIVNFHGLSDTLTIPIGAVLKQAFSSNVKSNKFGFRVSKQWNSKKAKYPKRYTITLI